MLYSTQNNNTIHSRQNSAVRCRRVAVVSRPWWTLREAVIARCPANRRRQPCSLGRPSRCKPAYKAWYARNVSLCRREGGTRRSGHDTLMSVSTTTLRRRHKFEMDGRQRDRINEPPHHYSKTFCDTVTVTLCYVMLGALALSMIVLWLLYIRHDAQLQTKQSNASLICMMHLLDRHII